tara:strand:+ start:18326 stop:18634 length:309 start_codon:yes stop_codon:yes gene_type:complete
MTNEMNLLTALCDALGFEVEKVCVNQDEIDTLYASEQEHCNLMNFDGRYCASSGFNMINAPLRPKWIDPIYEYKITKRDGFYDNEEALRQSRIHATMFKEKL